MNKFGAPNAVFYRTILLLLQIIWVVPESQVGRIHVCDPRIRPPERVFSIPNVNSVFSKMRGSLMGQSRVIQYRYAKKALLTLGAGLLLESTRMNRLNTGPDRSEMVAVNRLMVCKNSKFVPIKKIHYLLKYTDHLCPKIKSKTATMKNNIGQPG